MNIGINMNLILSLLIIGLLITALLVPKKVFKVSAVLVAVLLLFIGIFGVRTHVKLYNLHGDKIDLKIRHVQLYNGHNFVRFTSHLSFDKLKNKVQSQYKNAFVYDGRIYVVKDNTIYSVSKEQDIRRFGIKCGEYVAGMSYLVVKENGKMYCVDFPREILSNIDTRETKATFEDIVKFYKNFRNVTISDNKILIDAGNQQHIISLDKNRVIVKVNVK